jgi:hypothetical protein
MAWMMKDSAKHVEQMDRVRDNPRYSDVLQEAHGDLGFALWLALVDKRLASLGISHNDLADFCSRDMYENGESPRAGALACLEGDDMYSILLQDGDTANRFYETP